MNSARKRGGRLIRLGMWMLFPILGFHYYLIYTGGFLIACVLFFCPYYLILALNVRHLLPEEPALRAGRSWLIPLFLFTLLLALASFRALPHPYHSISTFGHTSLTFVMLFSYVSLYCRRVMREKSTSVLVEDLFVGVLLFAILNFGAVFLLGVEAPQAAALVQDIKSRIGLTETWVFFPFSRNHRDFAQAMGLLALLGVHLFLGPGGNKPTRRLRILGVVLFAFLLIALTDARMVFLQTILSVAIMIVLYRRDLRVWVFPLAILGNLLLPLLYLGGLFYLKVNVISLSPTALLSGRFYIWAVASYSALQQDVWSILTGFGKWSHRSTGLMDLYLPLFQGAWSRSQAPTFHNLAFQLFFDTGLLGVGLYLMVLFRSMKAILAVSTPGPRSQQYRSLTLPLVLYVFFSGVGVTESISPLYYSTFFFVLVSFGYYQAVVIHELTGKPGGKLGESHR